MESRWVAGLAHGTGVAAYFHPFQCSPPFAQTKLCVNTTILDVACITFQTNGTAVACLRAVQVLHAMV